jgi:hypothetical protein
MLMPQHVSIISIIICRLMIEMIETCCGNNIGRGEEGLLR